MPRSARLSLALAVAWAGGFASLGGGRAWGFALALALAGLTLAWLRPAAIASSAAARGSAARGSRWLSLAGLSALLGLFVSALVDVVVEVPAAGIGLLAAAVITLGLGTARTSSAGVGRGLQAGLIAAGALIAALAGAELQDRALATTGAAYGGPLLGAHPRQAIAVRIDGFGPHDVITPDRVEPRARAGLDAAAWAAWLEAQLDQIARDHYAEGPARAREAYADARVEAGAPARSLGSPGASEAISIHSGTSGPGSRVRVVCPSRTFDPRPPTPAATQAACPTKYQADGTTGLGLSRRWPGYVELRGRAWPPLGRGLALVLVGLFGLILVGAQLARARADARAPRRAASRGPMVALAAASFGLVALVLALAPAAAPLPSLPSGPPPAAGPGLVAVVLICAHERGDAPSSSPIFEIVLALVLALLIGSPVARASAPELGAALVERLVLTFDLQWTSSAALVGAATAGVLAVGAGICALALTRALDREPEHTLPRRLAPILATLAAALAWAWLTPEWSRKPGELGTLLASAAALHLAASSCAATRPRQLVLAAICASAPASALALVELGPLAAAVALVSSLACLALGLRELPTAERPTPVSG